LTTHFSGADERRRSAFGLPLALAAERRVRRTRDRRVNLAALVITGFLATAEVEATPLPGCLSRAELVSRIVSLRDSDWNRWSRKRVADTWPRALGEFGREYRTNEVISLRRSGRLIEGSLECAEDYLFDLGEARDGLEQITFTHAEGSRGEALAVAQSLIAVIGPPPDAGPTNMVCIHCADPGETLTDRQWRVRQQLHTLRAFLREGARTFVVTLEWARRQ
jgi:hypothetical protein